MSIQSNLQSPMAAFGSLTARELQDVTHDPAALDSTGRWAVSLTFEGQITCARFSDWSTRPPAATELGAWQGPSVSDWRSSLDQAAFMRGVDSIRASIAAGDVYQVNLCRILSADLPDPQSADPAVLAGLLSRRNPAPYGGFLRIPDHNVVTASPELFLARRRSELESGPIKGTGATEGDISDKDRAENIMIVDLMRNDLGRICYPGSVHVPRLLEVQQHPGLVHLVSKVTGTLQDGMTWPNTLSALSPAGSISGAPKISALNVIGELEPSPRGPYCGAVGWVDADRQTAELAVGIRTFWLSGGQLHFGTGAGITWGSDSKAEWEETELKSRRLLRIASEALDSCSADSGDQE